MSLSLPTLLLFLLGYFLVFYLVGRFARHFDRSKSMYLVADRQARFIETTLVMIGSWFTGLALVGAPQHTYNNGWPAMLWFSVPQLVSLWIFAWFSVYVSRQIPEGYTISSWIQSQLGKRVAIIYQAVFIFASFGFMMTTYTAVFKFLKFADVGSPGLITFIVLIGTIAYSVKGGIKASLLTGSVQTLLTMLVLIVLTWFGLQAVNASDLQAALMGKNKVSGILDTNLMLNFGLTMAITLLSGPVMSIGHHQKIFAQQRFQPWKTWAYGAPIFFMMLLSLCFMGTLALAKDLPMQNQVWITLPFLAEVLGPWALLLFGLVVLNSCCIVLDSHGNAIASIVAHDWTRDESKSVLVSKWTLVVAATLAWLISLLDIDVTMAFYIYTLLRVNMFVLTFMIFSGVRLTGNSILYAMVFCAPITLALGLYGNFNKQTLFNLYSVCLATIGPPILALLVVKSSRSRDARS